MVLIWTSDTHLTLCQVPGHLLGSDYRYRDPLHLPARYCGILDAEGHGGCQVLDGELQTSQQVRLQGMDSSYPR